jgi:aspartyl-tRNA(Asn)/glutamyl-tRNA(Gln) amidotransferase subunit B
MSEYGLSLYDASSLTEERATADWYEAVVKGGSGKRDPKIAANWVLSELFGALNKAGLDLADSPVSADALGGLMDLLGDGTISGRIAKDVFAEMLETGKDAAAIVEEKGLKQVSDTGAIEAIVDAVLAENQDKVAEYRGGKDKLFGFFVGQTMKRSGGKANPGMVNELLKAKLAG